MISLFPASTHPNRPAGAGPLALIRNAQANFPVRRSFSEGGCSMKISEIVRQYTAQQGIAEEEALAKGMEEKSKEFVANGAEVYSNS
jgi:hypothetical protein